MTTINEDILAKEKVVDQPEKSEQIHNANAVKQMTSESAEKHKKTLDLSELKEKTAEELLELAEERKISTSGKGNGRMLKQEIIFSLMKKMSEEGGITTGSGVVEILPDGFGFLRSASANYAPSTDDVYISNGQIKKFNLRTGDIACGEIRPPGDKERYFTLTKVHSINSTEISELRKYVHFDNLLPLYPEKSLILENNSSGDNKGDNKKDINMRAVDIVTPLGKGQRALIVAPPRTGKTILLQQMADSIAKNHPFLNQFL